MPSSTSSSEREPVAPVRSLVCGGLLLVAAAAGVQLADPIPPILTGNDQSQEQYESFRAHVEQEGPYDVIVFGNSMARQAIISASLMTNLGPDLRVFNYASGGTSSQMLPYQIEMAHGIDRPPHSIIVLSLRHTGVVRREVEQRLQIVKSSPYGAALSDPLPWRGELRRWLLDNVSLYAQRYDMKSVLIGEIPESRKRGKFTRKYGYRSARQRDPEELDWEGRCDQYTYWEPAGEIKMGELAGTIGMLQERGSSVTLTPAAVHPPGRALLARGAGDDPEDAGRDHGARSPHRRQGADPARLAAVRAGGVHRHDPPQHEGRPALLGVALVRAA